MSLTCGCDLESGHTIPDDGKLGAMSLAMLRAYLNSHRVGPTGKSTAGLSTWRNTASHGDILVALKCHRDKSYHEAPTPANHPNLDKLPDLVDELTKLLAIVDPEEINRAITTQVDAKIEKIRGSIQQVQITLSDDFDIIMESQHKDFPSLLRVLAAGVNVMMVGPAGSGKTEAAMAAAKALNREFELVSVGPQTMQSELAGYKNPLGAYVESAVRRAYQSGKVLIIDEIDSGNAGVFTFTNATLSNAHAGYPDGVASRHPQFQVIACANTFGTGADMVYIGRSQLDGATLDRYCTLVWDYDSEFEMTLALSHNSEARPWVEKVQGWRENMMKHKLRHIISPRASIYGAKLMKQGFSHEDLAKMLVFKGLNKEAADKIRGKETA